MIVANARLLTQNVTGVQQFAIELSLKLKDIYGDAIQFFSPADVVNTEIQKKLDAKVVGKHKGHLWEQFDLSLYLRKANSPLLLNMCNTAPLFYRNSIVTICDLAFPHHLERLSKAFTLCYNFLIPKILRRSQHIFMDSVYVKNDVCEINV